MKKIEWLKKQIEEAYSNSPHSNPSFLDQLVERVSQAGETIKRTEFKKIFQEVEPDDPSEHCDYMSLDIQLSYSADYSEAWNYAPPTKLPEIKMKADFEIELPADFVKLGGKPEWVQNEQYPICDCCDNDMSLFAQFKSLPYETKKKLRGLSQYTFGDLGNLYVFICTDCSEFKVISQCG